MAKVNLNKVKEINFHKIENPLSKTEKDLISIFWNNFSENNKHFFNGNIIAIHKIEIKDEVANLQWYNSNYAHYLIRNHFEFEVKTVKILFCSFLLETNSDKVVIGKMSKNTASPSKLQLPGGNIELINNKLNSAVCKQNTVRELKEEIGLEIHLEKTKLWAIKSNGNNGDIGIIFRNKERISEQKIQNHFNDLIKQSENSELSKIYFANNKSDFSNEDQRDFVDYLEAVLEKYNFDK